MTVLELTDVSNPFGEGTAAVHALGHVTFPVEPGAMVAVMGPSGAGKSTGGVPEDSGYPSGDMRVSDAERDHAVSELSAAFQEGRLSMEEFDERSGRALGARTGKELAALLADLPLDRASVTPTADLEQAARRSLATRVAVSASAVAAVSLGVIALANATSTASVPAAPNPPVDWAGAIVPGAFAILFVAIIVTLRAARPKRLAEPAEEITSQ
jgi:hypothetical protein